MKLLAVLLVAITLSLIIVPTVTVNQSFAVGKKDAQAKKAIIQGIVRAAEGKWRSIDMVNISKFNSSESITVYNKTVGPILPQPPVINQTEPQVCNIKEHLENGVCVPDVEIPPVVNNTSNETQPLPACPPGFHLDETSICVPNTTPIPPPTPTVNNTETVSKVCLVGDLSGNTVPNLMRINACDLKIGLGDLGYLDTLSYFKGLNFDKCLQGNHESANEDGTSSIEKETQAYCGNSWNMKIGNSTLIFAFNTNGNLNDQLTSVKQIPLNGIKTVFVLSHKPCYTSPNSHHPIESGVKAFCDSLAKSFPTGVKIYYIAGHNHQMASTTDGLKFISGAGGKSHYTCGTDNLWNFCNNKSYGYLEATIGTDGHVATKFVS